jgi:DNA processing protein
MIVNTLKVNDPGFPDVLKPIPQAPKQLYWAGNHPQGWLDRPRVAIVGSRKLTGYGRSVAERLASELARAGVVIISGLAFGIDVTAHQAALAAGGQTVAVLGSGLDQITPAAHANIARQILQRGSIITEYPLGANTYAGNFIARNRIISGLADVVVIPEAALKSGSLHTARFAMEQGKTVMAVPGNITSPMSEGCNNLIKSGAVPITGADDVFFALNLSPAKVAAIKSFSGTKHEELIYSLIRQGISAQEELVLAAQIDSPSVSSSLTMLEISGFIRPVGNGNWVIA